MSKVCVCVCAGVVTELCTVHMSLSTRWGRVLATVRKRYILHLHGIHGAMQDDIVKEKEEQISLKREWDMIVIIVLRCSNEVMVE